MSDEWEAMEAPADDGPPFVEVTSQEDMVIFSVTAVDPEEQPLADALSGALSVASFTTGTERSLIIGADAFRQSARREQIQEHFGRLYQEAEAAVFTWRGERDNDLADAVASTWALQPPKRPKRPRAEVTLPWERCYVTGEMRKEMAQRLREVADLVEAGYNLHAAETHDYDQLFHMRFELSGEPVVNYPADNSPALGGQKET